MRTEKEQLISSPMRVLVTDGQERAALAVTRGLGKAGVAVIVGAESDRSLASASRYCSEKWHYPSPLAQQAKFVASVKQAIEEFQITHVIAITDATVQTL